MPLQLGGAPPCERCGERVYYADQKIYMMKYWHKKCFNCDACKKMLTDVGMANLLEEGELICNQCVRKLTSSQRADQPQPEFTDKSDPKNCPRCGKTVYFAEEKIALGRKWHKSCFCCAECRTKLDSRNMADHEGEVYCKSCHGRKFGPKGYGFAGGAATMLAMDQGQDVRNNGDRKPSGQRPVSVDRDDPRNCPRCGTAVYFAEEKIALSRKWHKSCFCCAQCKTKLDSRNMADHEGEVYCKSCHGRKFGPKGYGFAGGAATMLAMDQGQDIQGNGERNGGQQEYQNKDDQECCPRCGKRVYFAEQVLALSRKWHKLCFKCGACGKQVDSTSCADHEGELYCRACHGKQFGPKGYGYAGGAGTMLSMDTGKRNEITRENVPHTAEAYVAPVMNKMNDLDMGDGDHKPPRPKHGSGDYCPRCDKVVYIAEKKQGAGHVYHISCFTCNACHKKLDSSILTEKEGEIYCRSCYQRNFGPKGYGHGAGAGILQMN